MSGGNMSEKIRGEHLQRGAYVYVRHSTPYQVRNHLEGKERQYALAERAKQLGFSKVIVIDEDLGRSGSGAQERVRVWSPARFSVPRPGGRGIRVGSFPARPQQSRLAPSGRPMCAGGNATHRHRWHL
jgi:hypothetical protein